ncbi:MAG: ABC transporter substrate-binding protein [Sulfobacillus thermotolerans]|nr:ABC transporter substrate-binding protein [Sulfobacillus thermotolerans]
MRTGLSNISVRTTAFMSVVVLAGCGSVSTASSSASNVPSGQLPTVVIGYENNGADPEMVAIARNYFSKYMHAHVELRFFSSGPASLTALGSGDMQFMTGIGNPPAVSAIAQGVPLQVIWAQELYTKDEGLVVRKGSGIHSLKDLQGKTVALVVGSTSPFELDTALKLNHLPISSVQFNNMSPPAMVAAWERHQINAAYVWDPAFGEMLSHGGQVLMYDQNVEQHAPIFNLAVVNSQWAKTHKALVEGFVRAEQAGYSYYRSHPNSAIKEMATEAGISVSLANSELNGYKLYDINMQLTSQGLGSGTGVASSLVTKSLTASAKYLQSIHTLSSIPSNMGQFVNPEYAAAVENGS